MYLAETFLITRVTLFFSDVRTQMLSKHLLSTKYLSEPVEFEKENVKLIVQFLSLILKYQII